MKKWIAFVLSYFLILNLLNPVSAFADAGQNPDVKISLLSEKETYEKEFEAEVQIIFYNQEIYHDEIFLSYHIFQKNEDGTIDILEFENQRIKVLLDESGVAFIALQVALKELWDKGAYIEFDLVDQSNLFWFSYNEAIKLETDTIEIFDRPIYKHVVRLKQAIRNETGIFALNLVVFVGAICIYIYVHKKKVFEW